MKLKLKPISDIPKESKHKTKWWFENLKLNVENENRIINGENLNWKLVVCVFEKWNLVVDEIEYVDVDVKKFGNGNVVDGGDGGFFWK